MGSLAQARPHRHGHPLTSEHSRGHGAGRLRGRRHVAGRNRPHPAEAGVTSDDIYVERNGDSMTIGLDYEVRRNLLGNLDVVVSFEKSIEVPVR